jgi:hypothetical protein
MKNITATIFLTIVVILGSAGVSWGATYSIVGYAINVIYIYVITICILVTVGIFVTRFYIQKRAVKFAKNQMRRCLVVWAVQGPFDNGFESMKAYREAMLLIFGEGESQKYLDAILGHEISYNQRPDEWEKTRSHALENGDLEAIIWGRKLFCMTEMVNMEKTLMDPDSQKRTLKKLDAIDILIKNRNVSVRNTKDVG